MDMLFIKLLNMSISASWLVLTVVILRLLLRKAPRWIHVCLWALVAVRLMCPVSIESVFSLIPSAHTVPEDLFYMEASQQDHPAVLEILEPRPDVDAVEVKLDVSVGIAQTRQIQWTMLWPVGMLFMLLHALSSYFLLKRKVNASIDLGNGVYICDYIETPFILGITRPQIYLPSSMDPDSASHVLAHERAHIARKDHWWKPLGYLLLTLYWFNPVLWLAYILLCRDIELACDEKVIRDMKIQEKKAYSEALLSCSISRRTIAACPLAFGEVGVKARVKSILNYRKPAFWIILTAVAALIITAVCFLTDPAQRPDTQAKAWFEEYVFEQEQGRRSREEILCIDAREGFALVYCQGQGPTLKLYQYDRVGNQIEILSQGRGDYNISGGMSLNHVQTDGKHIYFGTISEFHYNPIADVNTWLNWDYLSITDAKGKTHKQDMTGKEGFLFVLDAPMEDFQAVDGLDTVCLNLSRFLEQGYSVLETGLSPIGALGNPTGRYYRAIELDYRDTTSVSYNGISTDKLFMLTEGYALLSLDAMDWSRLTTVARFYQKDLPEDFAELFLLDPEVGSALRENNQQAWECWGNQNFLENNRDVCYLLKQKDGKVYLVTASRWTAQYREGQSKALQVYRMEPVETDDPYAQSINPYQWTLNLRKNHVQQVEMTSCEPAVVLSQQEQDRLMRILNSLTKDQISLGRLKHSAVASAHLVCRDDNGENPELDVILSYDSDTVQLEFSPEAAKRYPQELGKSWIIRSDALNRFLSIYTRKSAQEDPFSDLGNAYNWCRNISLGYFESIYIFAGEKNDAYLADVKELTQRELVRILNALPESAFEQSEKPEKADVRIDIFCRNVRGEGFGAICVQLERSNGELYCTMGSDGEDYHKTWKIKSHALTEFIRNLTEDENALWRELPVTGGIGHNVAVNEIAAYTVEDLEISVPQYDCFVYQVDEDGIRFRPEHVQGWILVQYRTEPFAVCGTGLQTSKVDYKNGKYTGTQGWFDGNKAWSFINLTATSGDTAYNVVLLNEETAPWVTEYHNEVVDLICELGFRVIG